LRVRFDTSYIYVNIGLGHNVQFTLQEALEFITRKVAYLEDLFNQADRSAADNSQRVRDVRSSSISVSHLLTPFDFRHLHLLFLLVGITRCKRR